jgi:hypothetical protein
MCSRPRSGRMPSDASVMYRFAVDSGREQVVSMTRSQRRTLCTSCSDAACGTAAPSTSGSAISPALCAVAMRNDQMVLGLVQRGL